MTTTLVLKACDDDRDEVVIARDNKGLSIQVDEMGQISTILLDDAARLTLLAFLS